jgi:hypothetical protein
MRTSFGQASHRDFWLAEEYGRNRMKAERLIPVNAGARTLYDRVEAVIAKNVYWV